MLQLQRSGYYAWKAELESNRILFDESLLLKIRKSFEESQSIYGSPRVHCVLREDRVACGEKRIARLMRDNQIQGVSRRRAWCVTTQRNKRERPAPDLVNRQFVATGINQLWVADMTYIPTWAGFIYLAVVTDIYSRKVVGWAFGETITQGYSSVH